MWNTIGSKLKFSLKFECPRCESTIWRIKIFIPFRVGDIIVWYFCIWISANRNDVVAIHKIFVGIFYFNHTLQAEQFITGQREKQNDQNNIKIKINTKTKECWLRKRRREWDEWKWNESYFSLAWKVLHHVSSQIYDLLYEKALCRAHYKISDTIKNALKLCANCVCMPFPEEGHHHNNNSWK